ncbi:hypothetical protein C8R46DRAFT_1257722 [Mycena filopes]|nr:hypothetical protein C8R46DRAFT_1257722 [Mycena filopes]
MSQPHLPSILKALQIPTKVHSVYLVGSRLWGTHSHKSDFDLLVVIADPASTTSFQKSQHKGQYDATVLTEAEFRAQVQAGSLIETLCCLIPPAEEECVLVHEESRQRRALVGNLQTMRSWGDERAQKDLEKARKFWAKGGEMREKGWKIVRHTIAAESILQGLQRIVDEEGVLLREVVLTQERLQRLGANGRHEDREWLGLEWEEVQEAQKKRIASLSYRA